MTLTNDLVEHQLYDSIIANPDDDAPRLIIADWYEENGFELRAKFIRNQIRSNDYMKHGLRGDAIDYVYDAGEFNSWSGPLITGNFKPCDVWYKRGFIWSLMMSTNKADDLLDYIVKKHPIQLVRIGKKSSKIPRDPIMLKSNKHKNVTYVICSGMYDVNHDKIP